MPEREVFIGIWTNWGKGPVLGLTLTVKEIYGVILIAALALVVKWAGSHFWGIVCFSLHRLRSSQDPQDGLHHQHQALLRAKTAEADLLWRLYEIAWAWRSSVPTSFRRSILIAILAVTNLAAWLVAGVFSASVTATNGEGLLIGKCGWLSTTADKDFPLWTQQDWAAGDALFVSAYNGYRDCMSYSKNCYDGLRNSTDAICNLPTVPSIESTMEFNASCPFDSSLCAGPTFRIDSGPIDSDTKLGMTAHPKDRIQVRKVTSCVSIPMESYSSGWTQEREPGLEMFLPSNVPNDTFNYYSLGSSWLFGSPVSNFTFVYSNYSLGVNSLPYNFDVRTHYAKNFTESGFMPIAELNRTDADVSLLILNNRVAYTGRVDDPLFRASRQQEFNRLEDSWISNTTVTGLACTEQYQFCNPVGRAIQKGKCSPLASLYEFDLIEIPTALDLSPRQMAAYRVIRSMIYSMRLNSFLMFLKNEILVATRLVYGSFGISTPLPDYQWQLEVSNMHNLSLAGLQLNAINHAAAPNIQIRPGLTLHDHIVEETNVDSKRVCRSQRARISGYSSFSMLGIIIIIGCSLFVSLVDYCLPLWISQFNNTSLDGALAAEEWHEDEILHLQQKALEGYGIGPWDSKNGKIPVIKHWNVRFKRDRIYTDFQKSGQQSTSTVLSCEIVKSVSKNDNKTRLGLISHASSVSPV